MVAQAVGAEFTTLSAVMSGVVEVRAALAAAQEVLTLNGKRTVLFIDEIHRFNKAQQDALLPHVEDGTVTLIGATTENPYSSVSLGVLWNHLETGTRTCRSALAVAVAEAQDHAKGRCSLVHVLER